MNATTQSIQPGDTVMLQRSPRTGGSPVVAGSPLWHKQGKVTAIEHCEPYGGCTAHVEFTFGADSEAPGPSRAVLQLGLDYLKGIK